MKIRNLLTIAILMVFTAGCASRKGLRTESNLVSLKGIIEISGAWIKQKSRKTDLKLKFANKSHDFLVLPFSDLECNRGGIKTTAYVPFNAFGNVHENREVFQSLANNALSLNPDEEKELILTCEFPESSDGPFTLRIKNIYRRVSESRKNSVLQNVGKDLIWDPNR